VASFSKHRVLDTGYQFPETLALHECLQACYGLRIRLVSASETSEHMAVLFGGPIYGTNPDHCCYRREIVPLHTALQGCEAWRAVMRRAQMPEGVHAPIVGSEPK
jgi:phosphoadenosine phosphosulfate reductase